MCRDHLEEVLSEFAFFFPFFKGQNSSHNNSKKKVSKFLPKCNGSLKPF